MKYIFNGCEKLENLKPKWKRTTIRKYHLESDIFNKKPLQEKSKKINNRKKSSNKFETIINNNIYEIMVEKLLSQQKMSFNTNNIPNITIQKYLERIFKYTEAEESTFIIALIYIDRINQISNIIITPYNIHRIIFISVLLAIKYNEDITFDFDYYAQVAGISIDELKSLEIEFVCLVKFKLYINKEQFDNYKSFLDEIDCEEGNKK